MAPARTIAPRAFDAPSTASRLLRVRRARRHSGLAQDGRDLTEEARRQYAQGLQRSRGAREGPAVRERAGEARRAPRAASARAAGALPQGRRADRAGAGRRGDRDVPGADRGLPGAAGAVQQPRRALRAEGRVRKRARGTRDSRSRPRPTGASRTRTWATSTSGSAPRSTPPPRSSTKATRRPPASSRSPATCSPSRAKKN